MRFDETVAEVRRSMAAPPAKVFRAFADASLVGRWLTPSPDVTLTVLDFEFRVGGKYRFAYHAPGGATMRVHGVYRVIEPPSRIVFSWNIEPPDEHAGIQSQVTVAITPESYYDALAIYRRDVLIPLGFLSMLIQAVIFAWLFERVFGQERRTLTSGILTYGALGAVLSWSFTTLAVAAKNVMSSVPSYLMIETGFTVAQWMLVAPLTAFVSVQWRRRSNQRVHTAG